MELGTENWYNICIYMLQKLGLERNHFLLALIPWAAGIISFPVVLFFASHVMLVAGIIVLVVCWAKKGVGYAGKVFLAFIILSIVWYLLSYIFSLLGFGWKALV